jgi:hypothetical protein
VRSQNVYQYAWDAARVGAVGYGVYCGVKLAWETAYEHIPDAFRSAELAKVSGKYRRPRLLICTQASATKLLFSLSLCDRVSAEAELQRELGQAWNPRERRPMSEREFLVLRSLQRRSAVEASIGWDRPVDMSESDYAAYTAYRDKGGDRAEASDVWARLDPQQQTGRD